MLMTIDKRGRINLPLAIRKELGLEQGTSPAKTLRFLENNPLPPACTSNASSTIRPPGPSASIAPTELRWIPRNICPTAIRIGCLTSRCCVAFPMTICTTIHDKAACYI
ncbi:MAG: AbrB/MazE/SpoVT family DNA-binding domain-containing protein [Desulfosarcina sp.]